MWSRFAIASLLFGCRATTPEPAAPEPEPTAQPVRAPEPPIVARDEAAPPDPPRVVAPPTPLTPIAIPFSADTVVVAPVVDGSPVVLFADETEAIRRRVVARLAALGHEVAPYEELARIETAAASGRLVLEGDRKCRAALTQHEVMARYFGSSVLANTNTQCFDEDCHLEVAIQNPRTPESTVFLNSRQVRNRTDPRAWAKAADSLDDRVTGIGQLMTGGFGASHPPPIMFGTPEPFGPWGKPPGTAELDTIAVEVNRCAHPEVLIGFTWGLRVSVAKSGRVTRCAAVAEHTQALPSSAACLCELVETLRYPAGKPGRRFRVDAIDDGGFRPDERKFRPLQAGAEVWTTRINEAPALDRCDARGVPPATKATTVVVDVTEDGSIIGVQVHGDITAPQSIAWAECMVEELPKIPLPCGPPGVQQLHLAFGPP